MILKLITSWHFTKYDLLTLSAIYWWAKQNIAINPKYCLTLKLMFKILLK